MTQNPLGLFACPYCLAWQQMDAQAASADDKHETQCRLCGQTFLTAQATTRTLHRRTSA